LEVIGTKEDKNRVNEIKKMKISNNIKFNSLIIIIAVIGVLAISSNINNFNKMTGFIVAGDVCATPNAQDCDGTSVLLCINGQWQNIGQIPGQCDYQTDAGNPPITDDNDSSDGNGDPKTWIIILIVILAIAILAIAGFIIYKMMKKKSGSKTEMNRKPFSASPGINPRFGPGGARPFLLKPAMGKPILQRPAGSTSLVASDVKRYVPPKR